MEISVNPLEVNSDYGQFALFFFQILLWYYTQWWWWWWWWRM